MRKILAYLNKVTFGLLSPRMAAFAPYDAVAEYVERSDLQYLEYWLAAPVNVYVDGVLLGAANMARATLCLVRSSRKLCPFASASLRGLPADIKSRMKQIEKTAGDVQLRFKGVPAITFVKDSTFPWCAWNAPQEENIAVLSLTAPWPELQDERFHELCKKYWPT